MSNIKDREKFNRLDSQIWKRTLVNSKGQTTLPKKLRQKLGINGKKSIVLWISVNKKKDKENEFLVEVGVKRWGENIDLKGR